MKAFVYEIIATAGAIDVACTRILKPFGLTPTTYNILNLLEDTALSQRELSDKLIVVASSVTFQVRQLQKRRLLTRRRADRRTWLVSLTPNGEQLLKSATAEMDKMIAHFQIDPAALTTALATLRDFKGQIPIALSPADSPSTTGPAVSPSSSTP